MALNSYEAASSLIELGASIHLAENDGWTPLIFAASNGFFELTELLLSSGADVHHANNQGTTALEYAVIAKNDEMVELINKYINSSPSETVQADGYQEDAPIESTDTIVNEVTDATTTTSTSEETGSKGEKKKGMFGW